MTTPVTAWTIITDYGAFGTTVRVEATFRTPTLRATYPTDPGFGAVLLTATIPDDVGAYPPTYSRTVIPHENGTWYDATTRKVFGTLPEAARATAFTLTATL